MIARLLAALTGLYLIASSATAQDSTVTFATVTRAPFSLVDGDGHAGFSVDLLTAIAQDLELNVELDRRDSFADMLAAVEREEVAGAIANISITAQREGVMDFSQPIFESGIQIMLPRTPDSANLFSALFTREIAFVILSAIGLLFASGLLMWVFERRAQPYFERPLDKALFPSFWWALNVVVNGGFEERMPQSRAGRTFGVVLIFSSLFLVSIFVATITAALTVEAIRENVQSLADLENRVVGTIDGSTAANFLDAREIGHRTYADLDDLLQAFEDGSLDAVVFDGPILAYYVESEATQSARLLERVYRPENYGIALPSGSPLLEQINQSLLKLREDGTYDRLITKWFGKSFDKR